MMRELGTRKALSTSWSTPEGDEHMCSFVRRSLGAAWLVSALAVAGSLPALPAVAQTITQAPAVELPPIVVEGATLAKPKVAARPSKKSAAGGEGYVPKPKKSKAGKKAPGANEGAVAASSSGPPAGAYVAPQDAGLADGSSIIGLPSQSLGSSVSVVTQGDIEARQVRQPMEALRGLPGVQVNRAGGPAALSGIRIRGGEANHTLVIIDGIVVNDPTTGDFDFSNILTDGVARMEVIRGPQSGLYGSNALAGVVNIITDDGRHKRGVHVSAQTEVGAFATTDASARISASNGNMWFSVGHHWREVGSFNYAPGGHEDDPQRFNQFSLRAGAEIVDGLVVDFTVRKLSKRAARDGFDGPVGSLATAFDDASTFSSDLFLTGAKLRWDSRDGRFTQIVRASRVSSSVIDDDATYSYHSDNEGIAKRFSYLATGRFATPGLAMSKHSLTGLLERQQDNFTALSDFADGLPHERNQLSYAGELHSEFFNRVTVTSGLRHDDNDSFDDFTTWRVAGALKLREIGMRPHASVGTGVKLPTMFEQYGFLGFFQPNSSLQPETSFGWDAGVEFTLLKDRAVLDVTYFEQDLRNKIKTLFTGAVNLPGESTRDGVEVALKWRLFDGLTVGGAYTWLDARDPDGLKEARRARHVGRFVIDYVFDEGRGRLNLSALYNGRARDDGFRVIGRDIFGFPALTVESVELDDYWLVNLAGSYEVAPNVELFGRVENLLDQLYEEASGYATPGIAAYAGIRVKLNSTSLP